MRALPPLLTVAPPPLVAEPLSSEAWVCLLCAPGSHLLGSARPLSPVRLLPPAPQKTQGCSAPPLGLAQQPPTPGVGARGALSFEVAPWSTSCPSQPPSAQGSESSPPTCEPLLCPKGLGQPLPQALPFGSQGTVRPLPAWGLSLQGGGPGPSPMPSVHLNAPRSAPGPDAEWRLGQPLTPGQGSIRARGGGVTPSAHLKALLTQ